MALVPARLLNLTNHFLTRAVTVFVMALFIFINVKKFILTILFLPLAFRGQCQVDWLRYNDNFNYLRNDSTVRRGTEKLKFIPLGHKSNFSLGGELREQAQYYSNFNFGDMPANNSIHTFQLWHRTMIHANIEMGKHTRIFAQAGSTFRFFNPNPPAPEIDENHLSLHQLFGEYKFDKHWMLRIGRQEMGYGSHRLITFREGPNTRLAFDAALARYTSNRRQIDVLVMSPVISRKGVFDDGTFKDLLTGLYATEKIVPRSLNVDYYFLHFESNRRKYNFKSGIDSREVAGARIFSRKDIFNYEFELTYQFGHFNALKVNAYALFADVSLNILSKQKLIAGFAGNYVSGDKDKNDAQLNTYNTLFSKPQYGLTAPIGSSNTVTFNPYVRISPIPKSNIYAGAYFMWRQSTQDGSYSPDGTELRPRPGKLTMATGKQIGTLLSLETSYSVNNHWALAFDASYFLAGRFIEQTGAGKDITYLSVKAAYKF